ncbi:MAG: tripartite tricarboxylate transporter TctB family protein [Limnohabitans sp.]|nr:tripartite tricarboxylate transporter TctB family protein [Limnohabitans sp.]
MKINDAVFGLLLTLISLAVLSTIQSYPDIPGQQVGPALFPGLIALALGVCGIVLMYRGWQARRTVPWWQTADWLHSPRHLSGFMLVTGGIVFYILASTDLGFLPAACLLMWALMVNLKVPPVRAAVLSLLLSALVHFAFYALLRVPLPWGVLTPWAW